MIVKLLVLKKRGELYDSIFVVYCRYSKIARYIPYREVINAAKLVDLMFNNVIYLFSSLSLIISDRGPLFTSNY